MYRSDDIASLFDEWFRETDEISHQDLDLKAYKPEPPKRVVYEGPAASRFELISVMWQAVESLTSADLLTRVAGLNQLEDFDAIRQLPLVAYVLVSRLAEPDIELRTRIVRILSRMITSIGNPDGPSHEVQSVLMVQLGDMRTRAIFSLLQVAEYAKSAEGYVADLISCCSYAGSHLAQILTNREVPKEIRSQAANFIGRIGYLDALPALERISSRLESRKEEDNTNLLPAIRTAVELLTTL